MGAEYHPGYEFKEERTMKDAALDCKRDRESFLKQLEAVSMLFQDKEYFAAYQVVQAFTVPEVIARPTKADYDIAIETMKRIESKAKK